MRELVYLSDRKLDQFLPELRSFWPRPKVNIKAPIVELAVEPLVDQRKFQLKHLTRVISQISKSHDSFTDPATRPGQWVTFRAPLNYRVVERAEGEPMVFFVDPRTSSGNYPTGGSIRLILHGSARHLRTMSQPAKVAAPAGDQVLVQPSEGGSVGAAFAADSVALLLNSLHNGHALAPDEPRPPAPGWARHLPTAAARLVRAIDGTMQPELFTWMAGHARVTASFPTRNQRYVLASPLYVELSTPPKVN